MLHSCPGRGAASFTLLRRAGTHLDTQRQGGPWILRRAWSLSPGRAMRGPECAARRAGSRVHECRYRKTLSPLVGLVPIELVIGRKRPVERRQAFERSLASVLLLHDQRSFDHIDDVEFVAGAQAHLLDQRFGQANGEAVAPFRKQHDSLHALSRDDIIIMLITART